MATPLRVGVIGLGRRWRRYRAALLRFHELFSIEAVCDQVRQRAEREARRLGAAAAGPAELFERTDIDAVLLLHEQWFGLWPLELACIARKPVYCALALESDEPHADAICRQVRESQL